MALKRCKLRDLYCATPTDSYWLGKYTLLSGSIVVQGLELSIEIKQALRVLVASGWHIQCNGICKDEVIYLGEHNFCIDFFVIPLGGFGDILGMNWLKNLGPIQRYFAHMSMHFHYEGQPVFLEVLQRYLTTKYSMRCKYNFEKKMKGNYIPFWKNSQYSSPSHQVYHPPGASTIVSS